MTHTWQQTVLASNKNKPAVLWWPHWSRGAFVVDVYRTAPQLVLWSVTCDVRGPFGPIDWSSRIEAHDETHAVEQYTERLVRQGFEIVGNVVARRV